MVNEHSPDESQTDNPPLIDSTTSEPEVNSDHDPGNQLQRKDERSFSARSRLLICVGAIALIGGAAIFTSKNVNGNVSHTTTSEPSTSFVFPKSTAKVSTTTPESTTNVVPFNSVEAPTTTTTTLNDFAKNPSWVQDFSKIANGPLNSNFWAYDTGTGGANNPSWGNGEVEYYTSNSSNVSVIGGLLNITALQENYQGSAYTSARIKTDGKMSFEYGKLDVVAKLPSGVGTWPAIWLLPQKNIYYYNSPASDKLRYLNDGEIDIMEAVGSQPDFVTSSAQSRTYYPGNNERIATDQVTNDATTFHDYGLEWTPDKLVYTVDGIPYHTVDRGQSDTYKVWPYDQSYYLIINLALGGNNGGQDTAQFPPNGINNSDLPVSFQIKSIRYYKYLGTLPSK